MRDNLSHMGPAVVWNEQNIPISVIYSDRRKSWAIEVTTAGDVLVRVPFAISEKRAVEIAQSRVEWIVKQQSVFQKRQADPRSYADGEQISFFGESLTIRRTIGPARAEISDGQLMLSIPDTSSPDDSRSLARDLVTLLYRRLGTLVLDPYVEKYAKLASVNKPRLRMRCQKKKWGCCTPKNGIIINVRVLLAPKIVAEYLVVHEIAHLRFPHHQKNYWDEVERLMPEYKNVEKLMKNDGWMWEF